MVAIFYTLTTLSLSLHLYIFSSFFPSCTYNPTGRCRVSFQFAFTWFSLPSVVVVAHILFFFLKDLHEPTPPSSRLLIITKFRRVTHAKIPPSTYHRRCAFPLTVMYTWLTLESWRYIRSFSFLIPTRFPRDRIAALEQRVSDRLPKTTIGNFYFFLSSSFCATSIIFIFFSRLFFVKN
jgi:hypothetical protein